MAESITSLAGPKRTAVACITRRRREALIAFWFLLSGVSIHNKNLTTLRLQLLLLHVEPESLNKDSKPILSEAFEIVQQLLYIMPH